MVTTVAAVAVAPAVPASDLLPSMEVLEDLEFSIMEITMRGVEVEVLTHLPVVRLIMVVQVALGVVATVEVRAVVPVRQVPQTPVVVVVALAGSQ